jgi:hypothetical protein
MLRLLGLLAAATLTLASCGDDDDDGAPAPAPQQGVTGTVGGQPFTAVDTSALRLGEEVCAIGGVAANASGLLLGFGTFQGLCAFVTQNQGCGSKANATIVTVLVARANITGASPGPVQPGTYTIAASTPAVDSQGNVLVADGLAIRNGATCTDAALPEVTGGTVQLTTVGTRVAGSVDLTFADGGRVAGSFDVPACGFQTDVCTVLAGGDCVGEPPCVP